MLDSDTQDQYKKRNLAFKETFCFDALPCPKEKKELFAVNLKVAEEYNFVFSDMKTIFNRLLTERAKSTK